MAEDCLIIGLGQIGMGYDLKLSSNDVIHTHSKSFSLHPGFRVLGGVDPDQAARRVFEKRYQSPAFSTIDEALKKVVPSIVAVASPTAEHYSSIKSVLNLSRPKAILCEKPLALNLDEARKIVELCEESGVALFVNYMRRSDPGVLEIKKRIELGQIELPIKGIVWYSKGLLHNGSHFFNLMEFWLGQISETKILRAGRFWDKGDQEPDVHVEFERGTVVFMAAWEESFPHYTVEFLSPSGRLRYEQGGKLITWQSTIYDFLGSNAKVLRHNPEIIFNDMGRYQFNVVNQLAKALSNQPHNVTTGRQALLMQEHIHKIIKQRV